MELHALIVITEGWSAVLWPWRAVGRDVGLQMAEQGWWLWDGFSSRMMHINGIWVDLGQGQLQLAHVAAQICQQPMSRQGICGVVGASQWLRGMKSVSSGCRRYAIPERGGRMRQPQMHVAMISKRVEYA